MESQIAAIKGGTSSQEELRIVEGQRDDGVAGGGEGQCLIIGD